LIENEKKTHLGADVRSMFC